MNVAGQAKAMVKKAEEMRAKYLDSASQFEINITCEDRNEILSELLGVPKATTFDKAQKSMFLLMIDGIFDAFLKSNIYKDYKGKKDPCHQPTSFI